MTNGTFGQRVINVIVSRRRRSAENRCYSIGCGQEVLMETSHGITNLNLSEMSITSLNLSG